MTWSAPSDFSVEALDAEEVVAMTRAPQDLANWSAKMETPPVPWVRTVWPGLRGRRPKSEFHWVVNRLASFLMSGEGWGCGGGGCIRREAEEEWTYSSQRSTRQCGSLDVVKRRRHFHKPVFIENTILTQSSVNDTAETGFIGGFVERAPEMALVEKGNDFGSGLEARYFGADSDDFASAVGAGNYFVGLGEGVLALQKRMVSLLVFWYGKRGEGYMRGI
jgi:hypothetical protein